MAKLPISPSTVTVTNIQAQADIVIGEATALKVAFDKAGADEKTYINDVLIPELNGDNGSKKIGHDSANLTSDNVADALEELLVEAQQAQAGTIMDGVVTDAKLSDAAGNIKDRFSTHTIDNLQKAINVKYPPSGYTAAEIDGTTDDTDAINALFTYGDANNCKNLFIPEGTCMIRATGEDTRGDDEGGLIIPSGWTIYMTPQTILKAIDGDKEGYAILNINTVENVRVIGGQVVGERDTHIGATGEYGFGVRISDSQNIHVEDVKVSECWGDGVIIRGTTSANVTLDDVISTNNRRQGLTIGAGTGGTIDSVYCNRCEFSGSDGTLPKSGVDIEGSGGTTVSNIHFSQCKFLDNEGTGITYQTDCNNSSIIDCLFDGNIGNAIAGALAGVHDNIVIEGNTFVAALTTTGEMIAFNSTTIFRKCNRFHC
jgi:hypothetical protein